MPDRPRPTVPAPLRELRVPFGRRAVVVGAGSFGTAVAVLLARGGLRTTLQARTPEQAERLQADRANVRYLPGVEFPSQLRIGHVGDGLARAEYVFLGVPSRGLDEVIAGLEAAGLGPRASLVSLAKGLVPPDGMAPTIMMRASFGEQRVACIGGPAHAREMVHEGAGLVAASANEELANALAQVFIRAGVVCEQSDDPVGVELAGIAKNAAALAAGATERQGLNAAGAAAGHIFAEVWRYAEARGARPESMIGLAGTGDLVATTLAPQSRNRRAGEMLADGVPGAEIPDRIGQAVESFETVPLLARALERAGDDAPVLSGLARLIAGDLPLDDWVALVRTTVPPPARWRHAPRAGTWERMVAHVRGWFARRPAELERPPV
ncbi:MAG: NAD-dependent glycerol-3-phosphate dehydrogenase domain protein [Solirubrobacterales bacterium]|jgi:glycerol-3-phosphate dehydrogenase (NAD(P)+)|nr:NAD-dependent glycerol-3-phosphate dehydrogenase domain protein [Solirubrobacterales bacterium]